MRILFVIAGIYFQEPIGIMQLSAICKKKGHTTRLVVLDIHPLRHILHGFAPDMVCYSTMSADEPLFLRADQIVKEYQSETNTRVVRIMGGPHPTFFPSVLEKMDLDAICIGEGDHAIAALCDRSANHEDFNGIPNVLPRGQTSFQKELVEDIDRLPWPDRSLLYEARPELQSIGLRSFLTSRGCPYACTYCFNHSFNKMFKGTGKLLRRRSVDNIIDEIKQVQLLFSPTRFIRFSDDTFVFSRNDWLEEFVEKYKKEIHLPFYCLMRSNTLTDDVARILSYAGCKSIGMALEAADEHIRNSVLKRDLSNDTVIASFRTARKHGLATYGGTILGIPGVTIDQEFKNVFFAKELRIDVPAFTIFAPYPGIELTEYAISRGFLDCSQAKKFPGVNDRSLLKCFTNREKDIQLRLQYLGTLYCVLPFFPRTLLRILCRIPFSLKIYAFLYSIIASFLMQLKIVPGASPRSLKIILYSFRIFCKYWCQGIRKTREEDMGIATQAH